MELISIIIPVYNVEKYLKRSLDCIIAQTYTNWEALLVVDGSPDNSGKICDEYAKKDSRFRVFHKDNQGVAAARNTGIENAKGDYISFIDSDDFAHEDMLLRQYEMLKKYEADLVITGYEFAYDDKMALPQKRGEITILDSKEAIKYILKNQQFCSPWTKLYKKKLFNNVKYPVGAIYEDLMTAFEIFMAADTIVYVDIPYYNYFQASESITRSDFHYGKLDEVKALKMQADFISRNYPEMENEAKLKYLDNVFGHIINLVTKDDEVGVEKYREFTQVIIDNYDFYRKNKKFSLKDSLRLWLMKNPKIYKKVYSLTGKS